MSDLPLGRLDDLAAFCIVSTEQLLISNGPRNLHTLHDQSCRDLSAMIPDVTGDTSQAASLKLKCPTPLHRSLHRCYFCSPTTRRTSTPPSRSTHPRRTYMIEPSWRAIRSCSTFRPLLHVTPPSRLRDAAARCARICRPWRCP